METKEGRDIFVIIKGAGIIFSGGIIGKAVRYVFHIFIAWKIGAGLAGLYFLGISISALLEQTAIAGLTNGVLRYVALYKGEADRQRIKGIVLAAFFVTTGISCILSVCLFFGAQFVSINIFQKPELINVLKILAITIPFTSLTTILIFFIRAFKRMQYIVYVRDMFTPVFRLLMVALLFMVGQKLIGVVASHTIAVVLAFWLALYYAIKVFPFLKEKSLKPAYETRKLLTFSLPLVFVQILYILRAKADTLILGIFRSSQEVGIYNIALRTAEIGLLALPAFNSIFAPMISELHNRGERERLAYLFKIVTRWIFSLSLPIFLPLIIFAQPIMQIFGRDFLDGAQCLAIIGLANMINSGTGPVGQIILMSGRSDITLINSLGFCITTILLNLLLVPKFGMIGAAWAAGGGIVLINLFSLIEVYFLFKIHPYSLSYLKALFAGSISTIGVLYYTKINYSSINGLELIIVIGGFLVCYSLLMLLFGLNDDDKAVICKIRERFSFAVTSKF